MIIRDDQLSGGLFAWRLEWTGSWMSTPIRGGTGAKVASMQYVWFCCPHREHDWELRITNDRTTVVPIVENGG